MTENHRRTLLVTGASGHLGQRVIELLLESNAGPSDDPGIISKYNFLHAS